MRRLVAVGLLAMLAAACAATAGPREGSAPAAGGTPAALSLPIGEIEPAAEAPSADGCRAGERRVLRTRRLAHVAVAREAVTAYRRPNGRAIHRFSRLNANGFPTVFGALEAVLDARCRAVWYHVQLPMRPNGVEGFVHAADVKIARVRTRIEIDLTKRRVELYRNGRLVLSAKAAVGSPVTPTPTGSYYVNQRIIVTDAWGPFGPAAIGISAFSPVLQDWAQGGPIAIHGTNDPASVGRAASHGCLRLDNETLLRLFEATPAGTPVKIVA